MIEIIGVGKREILIEPFGGKEFGGGSPMRAAVGKLDAHANETLWRLRQGNDAEAEGHA